MLTQKRDTESAPMKGPELDLAAPESNAFIFDELDYNYRTYIMMLMCTGLPVEFV